MNWVVAPQNCSTVGTYCNQQGNLEPMDYLTLSAVAKVMVSFRDHYRFKGPKWLWARDCILVSDPTVELVTPEDLGLTGMRLNLWVLYSYRSCKFKFCKKNILKSSENLEKREFSQKVVIRSETNIPKEISKHALNPNFELRSKAVNLETSFSLPPPPHLFCCCYCGKAAVQLYTIMIGAWSGAWHSRALNDNLVRKWVCIFRQRDNRNHPTYIDDSFRESLKEIDSQNV